MRDLHASFLTITIDDASFNGRYALFRRGEPHFLDPTFKRRRDLWGSIKLSPSSPLQLDKLTFDGSTVNSSIAIRHALLVRGHVDTANFILRLLASSVMRSLDLDRMSGCLLSRNKAEPEVERG